MTKDDIIRMAREAGMAEPQEVMYNNFWTADQKELEHFAALVAAAEREACAKVCVERVDAEYATGKVDHNEMGWTQACAIAIRARGQA